MSDFEQFKSDIKDMHEISSRFGIDIEIDKIRFKPFSRQKKFFLDNYVILASNVASTHIKTDSWIERFETFKLKDGYLDDSYIDGRFNKNSDNVIKIWRIIKPSLECVRSGVSDSSLRYFDEVVYTMYELFEPNGVWNQLREKIQLFDFNEKDLRSFYASENPFNSERFTTKCFDSSMVGSCDTTLGLLEETDRNLELLNNWVESLNPDKFLIEYINNMYDKHNNVYEFYKEEIEYNPIRWSFLVDDYISLMPQYAEKFNTRCYAVDLKDNNTKNIFLNINNYLTGCFNEDDGVLINAIENTISGKY